MPLLGLQSSERKLATSRESRANTQVPPQVQRLHVYGSGTSGAFEVKSCPTSVSHNPGRSAQDKLSPRFSAKEIHTDKGLSPGSRDSLARAFAMEPTRAGPELQRVMASPRAAEASARPYIYLSIYLSIYIYICIYRERDI